MKLRTWISVCFLYLGALRCRRESEVRYRKEKALRWVGKSQVGSRREVRVLR